MAKEKKTMASVVDDAIREAVIGGLAGAFTAGASRRTDRADQLSGDSQAMWSIAMTSPTIMAAAGIKTMSEAGSGRTRAETNNPAGTGAGD